MSLLTDRDGNMSSFRVIWGLTVLMIIFTWAYVSWTTKALQPFPLDGVTTIGLFGASAAKTFTENRKPLE